MPAPGTCTVPFERGSLCKTCRVRDPEDGVRRCSKVVAASPSMVALMARALRVAGAEAPVVILGESGVGKEVLARVLHSNSPRREKPMVAVNVAALPGELLESELFGHAKGAFTGAHVAKKGLMEVADGGTLFLDEVGDMPMTMQAKLLRALQGGEVRRVGETQSVTVDVRVFCATHRDLAGLVASGQFRQDLYYRLKVFALTVPPLRERTEDLPGLCQLFLAREGHPTTRITAAAWRVLRTCRWPGNVRELSNAIQHAAALCGDDDIGVDHLPPDLLDVRNAPQPPAAPRGAPRELKTLEEVERNHILWVLESCGGHQAEAARVLGIGRNTLWRKLKQLQN